MKRYALVATLAAVLFSPALYAQTAEPQSLTPWYLGLNPIAAVVPFSGYYNIPVQVMSAEEVGLAVSGGYFLSPMHALEGRLSLGMPNRLEFLTIGSFSWKVFPFQNSGKKRGGFFFGPDIRAGAIRYTAAEITYVNLIPSVDMGWYFSLNKRIFLNIRLLQSFAVMTFSSDKNVKPAASWMLSPVPVLLPVMPVIAADVGYQF